jgi:multidrug efflux pump subunit AcrA (membrane-fusion protein)
MECHRVEFEFAGKEADHGEQMAHDGVGSLQAAEQASRALEARRRAVEALEAGGLVCEIANTRRMHAEIFVPEREVDAIALGMPATVKVKSYPIPPFEGKVDFIASAVNGGDKRVRVVVGLDNPEGRLAASMSGHGEVVTGKHSLLHLATRHASRWIRVRYLR